MKKIILLSSLMALSHSAFAAPRSEEAAREIAYNHFVQKTGAGRRYAKAMDNLTLAATSREVLGAGNRGMLRAKGMMAEAFYIYNHGTNGFVIVSGDDSVEPILAYGNEGGFDVASMPVQLREWLQTYADEMNYVLSASARPGNVFSAPSASVLSGQTVGNEGVALSDEARRADVRGASSAAYPASVAPILQHEGVSIQWDQNAPFNGECPSYTGYVCPTGCVATAFAQIMYYHRWPEKGQGGTKTYISDPHNLTQSFNFSAATFDFDKMLPHYYYGKYSEEQGKEVAKLCHGIGVAVDMQYSPSGSGAYSVYCGDALVKYFNYDKNIHYAYRDYFTQDEWLDMIKKEISEGRPICYAGSSTSIGHQFVFDGYDAGNRVHVNWGWAGMSDGYFSLSVLAPSSTGTGGGSVTSGGFIYNQAMWMGMQRPSDATKPVSFLVQNIYSAYDGSYDSSSLTLDKHTAILGEEITLSTKEIANLSVAFNGICGMIIEDAAGQQTVLSTTASKSLRCGIISRDPDMLTHKGVIPAGLADGSYTLYLASKADGEARWSRIRAAEGYCDYYEMTVSGGSVTFAYNGEPDGDGTLMADHPIYTKCRSQFTARITNKSKREYFGVAHVGIYNTDAEGQAKLVAICGREQIILPVGEETEVVFRGSIEAAAGTAISTGDYKACVIVENQGKYYQMSEAIDITVKRIPSGMASLSGDDFSLSQSSYGLDEPIMGHVKVTNSRSVYSDFIGIIIFKEHANQGSPYWEKEVFLEQNASAEYDFSIPAQFEPGVYKASLRYTGGAEYSNEIASQTFEVRNEFVGVLSPEAAQTVLSEEYYNLSGQKLAGKPMRGSYIRKASTEQGVRVTKHLR